MTETRAIPWLAAACLALAGTPATPQSRDTGKDSIRWIKDWKQGTELAAKTGRPILLDFWCGT